MGVSRPLDVHVGRMAVEEERAATTRAKAIVPAGCVGNPPLDPLTEAFTPKMASALRELRAHSEVESPTASGTPPRTSTGG
jgi:hypothetical protein